jgi:hypothetical protein
LSWYWMNNPIPLAAGRDLIICSPGLIWNWREGLDEFILQCAVISPDR